jgi:hypothetical protein
VAAVQAWTSDEDSPLALHWRTSVPLQNSTPRVHTTSRQVAATQTCWVAAQFITVLEPSPSAAHCRIASDPAVVSQVTAEGVQTWLRHEGTPAVTAQVWEVPQAAVTSAPLPSWRHITTALFWHEPVPPVHTSGTQVPLEQNWAA